MSWVAFSDRAGSRRRSPSVANAGSASLVSWKVSVHRPVPNVATPLHSDAADIHPHFHFLDQNTARQRRCYQEPPVPLPTLLVYDIRAAVCVTS